MTKETIAIASDHGGYHLKAYLSARLADLGFDVLDLGAHDSTTSVDYPDFADSMADALKDGTVARGVLVCGSGIGISIRANRHAGVRAALIHDAYGARMSREHNDANVIVFGGRVIGEEIAKECLEIFIKTEFEGGRHARRVDKLG